MSTPQAHLFDTFARADIVFERGEGAWLYDEAGERYLDFAAGVAVNVLGHCHPHLVEAIKRQAERLWHTSNLYRVKEQERLGDRLCALSFADRAFFCNSGAEALEGAIKTARRYHYANGAPERVRIIAMEGAFHGRTLATLAAGGQKKYLEGFGPVAGGFDHVPFADLAALKAVAGPETAAVLVEAIQGEGGVRPVPSAFLRDLRAFCDEAGILMIFDEVQTGIGRTGRLFAYEWSGVTPDIMALAKGLGGGFPIGAILATEEAAAAMTPGSHGSTFGGNPLAMAVANAVIDVVAEPAFLEQVRANGLKLKQSAAAVIDGHPDVFETIRGEGLLLGIRCRAPAGDIVAALRAEKMLVASAGDNVVRFIPPLNIGDAEIAEAVGRLDAAARRVEAAGAAS
jgi:acetylornithine/N-succinyldiaminopimelate aminotransferase